MPRKVITTYTIEPLADTPDATKLSDYEADKSFIEGRYHPVTGTSGGKEAFTYEFDDTNKKITLVYTDLDWERP